MWIETFVDIYIFQNGAVPYCYIVVPYIYMELDYYVLSTCYMLDNCPPKARQTMEQLILTLISSVKIFFTDVIFHIPDFLLELAGRNEVAALTDYDNLL